MSSQQDGNYPLILWPVVALWRFLALAVQLTGRFLAVIVGLVFMIVGVALSLTLVGAVVGIPLFLLGLALVTRGFF